MRRPKVCSDAITRLVRWGLYKQVTLLGGGEAKGLGAGAVSVCDYGCNIFMGKKVFWEDFEAMLLAVCRIEIRGLDADWAEGADLCGGSSSWPGGARSASGEWTARGAEKKVWIRGGAILLQEG